MKNKFLYMVMLVITTLYTQAQLGNVLNKATAIVTERKIVDANAAAANSQAITNELHNNNPDALNEVEQDAKDENTPKGYYLVNNPLGKMVFSNQPFTAGTNTNKSTFNSNEFIYGRLQLNEGTIKDAFKIAAKGENIPFYSIEYVVVIYKKGEKKFNNEQIWNSCLVKDADITKTYFDFDVLPNPLNATTVISAVADFSAGKSTAPLYSAINPQVFYENGMYKVDILLRHQANDAWGNSLDKNKWPTFEADFDFIFTSDDVATLKKNAELASSNAKNKMQGIATEAEAVPKQWTEKSAPLVMGFTQPQLLTMYQNSFSNKMDAHTIVKFHASSANGGWTVVNNEYGIPKYRYSNQWYTIFIKYANGKTCFYQGFGLRQQYNGGGTYGQAAIDKNEYHLLNCDKLQ